MSARARLRDAPLAARNPRVQRLRRLAADRRARAAEGAFVIDGPTLVADAIDAGLRLESVFVADDAPARVSEVADRAAAGGALVQQVVASAFIRAADPVSPQGIVAVAAIPARVLADVAGPAVLVLVDVGDPGNAGTLVRTAEAAGLDAVVFCRGSVDPYAPKVVRASAGALFRTPVVVAGEPGTVLGQLGASGRHRLGTSAHAANDYDHTDLTACVALVLGSEAHGLPAELGGEIDEWVRIPMTGRAESLNVAMAGTALCFELARQRRHASAAPGPDATAATDLATGPD